MFDVLAQVGFVDPKRRRYGWHMMTWSSRTWAGVVGGLVLSLAAHASAQLTQPNGTVIPTNNNLLNFLNGQGETINPLTDAAITPETFTPKCQLTFTVIGRGAGYRNSFGWYNVTGTKPTTAELFEFVGCGDVVGVTRTLDLRNDVRYLGGEIGFFQATPENRDGCCSGLFCNTSNCGPNCAAIGNFDATVGYVFYSEARYNPDSGSSPTIHLLTMDSRAFTNAFYFGWEDKYSGNDNDFEDLLMRVEGVQCSGGGAACETGIPGVCADGVMQCRNGVLTCVNTRVPSAETCNALDDDCDGASDEGDGLCEVGKVCDRGMCIGDCGLDNFCPDGLMCADTGRCIDPLCATVMCDAGLVCLGGNCVAPCDGVVCPFGQICRSGVCVEKCLGGCEAGQACDDGICISCDCDRCSGSRLCAVDVRQCIEPACGNLLCDNGTHCEVDSCIPDCQGVVCPRGFMCELGQCVAVVTGGTGGSGAIGGLGGSGGISGSGGVSGSGGSSGSAGFSGAGGASGMAAGSGGMSGISGGGAATSGAGGSTATAQPGCGCTTVGHGTTRALTLGWLVMGIALFASRLYRRLR